MTVTMTVALTGEVRVPWGRPLSRIVVETLLSVAILPQVGIRAPGLSFRCICHLDNPIKTRLESGFCLLCTSHCSLSRIREVWKVWLCWFVSALCGGLWVHSRSQPRAGLVGIPSRALTSLCPNSYPPMVKRKNRNSHQNASPRSSWISWSDSPREQSAPSSEGTVMEDCTETHQAEISRKIKANDKLRNSHERARGTQSAHLR